MEKIVESIFKLMGDKALYISLGIFALSVFLNVLVHRLSSKFAKRIHKVTIKINVGKRQIKITNVKEEDVEIKLNDVIKAENSKK